MTGGGKAPVFLMGAMESECNILLQAVENGEPRPLGNGFVCRGTVDGYPVAVLCTRIGSVNAAMALTALLEREQPRCVILQGSAGAHSPLLHPYDLVLGETVLNHAAYYTPRREQGKGSKIEKWTFPGAQVMTGDTVRYRRSFRGDPALMALAETVPYSQGKRIRGVIASGDVWNRETDRILFYHRTMQTDCEEMEGFAVSQVCACYGVPMLDVRIVSNSDLHPGERFTEDCTAACQQYCLDLLRKLIKEK